MANTQREPQRQPTVAPPIKLAEGRTAAGPAADLPAAQDVAGNGSLPAATGGALVSYDFGEDAGHGYEQIGKEERLTPFLAILQALSPQCDQASPLFIQEARPGMLINTAIGQVYDGRDGVEIMACWNEHLVTKWIPRDAGGGFRGTASPNDPLFLAARREQGQFKRLQISVDAEDAAGRPVREYQEWIDQYNVGILYAHPSFEASDEVHSAILAFTSTKIPVFRAWISAMMDIRYRHPATQRPERPPLWAHRLRLVTVPQKNAKGSFFNFRLRLSVQGPTHLSLVPPSESIYAAAKEFDRMWRAADVRADYAAEPEASGGADGGDDPPF